MMDYINAFWVGGLICVVGQLLLSLTNMTPARILVTFVTAGCILTALGLYAPLVEYAGAGATVPLTGFGYSLAKGVIEQVAQKGAIGIFTGGVMAAAAGIRRQCCLDIWFRFCLTLRSKNSTPLKKLSGRENFAQNMPKVPRIC